MMEINKTLLTEIDGVELSERIQKWRQAMRNAPWRLYAERDRYTVASWRESEGEDIQLRRAALIANVLENITVSILEYDSIAGRPTPGIIGALTSFDVCGDYIPDIWLDSGEIGMTLNASSGVSPEDLEIMREAVRCFGGRTAPDMCVKAWRSALGSWAEDALEAKLKDPSPDVGIFGQVTSVLLWDKLLKRGLRSFIDEAKLKISQWRDSGSTDIDKLYFWQSSVTVLEAVISHAHRYSKLAREMAAKETDAARRAELEFIAESCLRVPEHPARTFREALQSMAIIGVCKLMEQPQHNFAHWGRADRYLYDYFIRDVSSGVLSVNEASQLIAELVGRWGTQIFATGASQKESHQVNFGINNILLGGLDANHEDGSNELSYLFLHVVGLLQLSSPTVGVRWNSSTPDWLMRKAIRTNLLTRGGIPLFQNDEVIIRHYVQDGIPFEEAREWCGLGCVYPCLPTRADHYGAEGVAGFNLAALLHMALHDGRAVTGKQLGPHTGDARGFGSIEELYEAFKLQHRFAIDRIFRLAAIARSIQHRYLRLPLISSLSLEASIELGQDLLIPHPDFSLYGISDRAIIDVADSLIAVKKLVFEQGRLTMSELIDALDSNFEGPGGEQIRQLCLAQPKFGNDIAEVDLLAREISAFSAGVIRSWDNSPFPNYKVAREGLAWHYFGGLGVGALPNGRRAFEPLNDGSISPMRGADTNGPTAVLRSALAAGFEDSYAQVLNQKFSSSILSTAGSVDKLSAYTQVFLESGGTHIQYNIIDREELAEAKDRPEEHRDLIVRIGGFSAYFVELSNEIQNDVIQRSEFII